ncbi:MAG: preprotein translocase subunit SecE, partial [Patescibacteria group bacterium]|nr:preprotein translocase subunit SecE [Patescibacteria group bacterium]
MVKSAVALSKDKAVNNKKTISPSQYLKESIAELKKVVWPTKKEVVKMTGIVIAVSLIVGSLIGGLDLFFTK